MEAKSQVELCLADRGRCRAQVAGTDRYWTEADGSWGSGRDWRGRNMGNGSIGVPEGKVFRREWLNFGVEWLFWRVQRQRSKVEVRTLRAKPREESSQPKLRGRVTHPLQETKPQRVDHPPEKDKVKIVSAR
jgi:hypothetical protein